MALWNNIQHTQRPRLVDGEQAHVLHVESRVARICWLNCGEMERGRRQRWCRKTHTRKCTTAPHGSELPEQGMRT